MMQRLAILAMLGFLCFLTLGCDQHAAEKEDLRALFSTMDNCYNNADGVTVLGLYTERTFSYYDSLLPIILNGTREQVAQLPAQYQYEVLVARLKGTRAELTGLTGRQYFAHATGRGWYRIPEAERTADVLGAFEFRGRDEAWAEVYTDGEATGLRFCFFREDGVWKIDEPRSFDDSHETWREVAAAEGMSLERFLVETLSSDEGRDVPATIWDPMPP